MGRPSSVKLGPFVFNIVWSGADLRRLGRVDGVDRFGMSALDDLRIYVDENRPLAALQNTLLHEILHCLLWVYDIPVPYSEEDNKMEEQYVCRMDSTLLLCMQENRSLFQWLVSEESHA